jgi:hypothetical protein
MLLTSIGLSIWSQKVTVQLCVQIFSKRLLIIKERMAVTFSLALLISTRHLLT